MSGSRHGNNVRSLESEKTIQRSHIPRILQFMGLAVLLVFLYRLGVEDIWNSISLIELIWFPAIIVFAFVNIAIRGLIWRYLLHKTSRQQVALSFSVLSVIAGISSGSIFPGRADIAKPLMAKKDYNIPFGESLPAMVIERLIYFISLLLLFFISLLFFIDRISLLAGIIGGGILIFLIGLLVVSIGFPDRSLLLLTKLVHRMPLHGKTRIMAFIEQFFLSMRWFRRGIEILPIILLTTSSLLIEALRMYWIFRLMGLEVSMNVIAFSFYASMVFSLATMIPGGVGAYETSQSAIIHTLDSSVEQNAVQSAVLFVRVVYYYFIILLGSLILLFYKRSTGKYHDGSVSESKTPEKDT